MTSSIVMKLITVTVTLIQFCPYGRSADHYTNSYWSRSSGSAPYSRSSGDPAPFSRSSGDSAPFSRSSGDSSPFSRSSGDSTPFSRSSGDPAPFSRSNGVGGGAPYSSRSSHIGPIPFINNVVNEWSDWGDWDACTRSCGGGVRSRVRKCVTRYPRVMPGSGIRTTHNTCTGESIEYSVCGTVPCPAGQVSGLSFRAAQCRKYNNRRVLGRIVNSWLPYTQGGINPCALVCEGEGQGIIYTFGKVTDGTYCKTDESHKGLCVNGRCLRLSCDGRLGGVAEEDMCRVCGGHNETCTRHAGVFHHERPLSDQPFLPDGTKATKKRSYGYHEVTKIPSGSTNVKVVDNSSNFLAIKSGDKYLLNGNWLIDWPGEVNAAGVEFTYVRKEDQSEALMSLGPTKEDLELMVLLRQHNPGIFYEYWTPSTVKPKPEELFFVPMKPTTPKSISKSSTKQYNHNDRSSPWSKSSKIAVLSGLPSNKTQMQSSSTSYQPLQKSFQSGVSTGDLSKSSSKSFSTVSSGVSSLSSSKSSSEHTSRSSSRVPSGISSRSSSRSSSRDSLRSSSGDYTKNLSKDSDSSWLNSVIYEDDAKKLEDGNNYINLKNEYGRKRVSHGKKKKVKSDERRKKVKESRRKKKKRRRPLYCKPCQKKRKAKKNFCTSDFVSHIKVLSEEIDGKHIRFETLIEQSYKNKIPLLHKEFLWQHHCTCRRLRQGKSYIVMGVSDKSKGNEMRLVLQENSYVRRFSTKILNRVMEFRRNEMKICRPWRRDVDSLSRKRDRKLHLRHSRRRAGGADSYRYRNIVTGGGGY